MLIVALDQLCLLTSEAERRWMTLPSCYLVYCKSLAAVYPVESLGNSLVWEVKEGHSLGFSLSYFNKK